MTAAEAIEAQRVKEERKRQKEEKKAAKDVGIDTEAQNAEAKKKKSKTAKKGADAAGRLLTDQERMNMFMNKFK